MASAPGTGQAAGRPPRLSNVLLFLPLLLSLITAAAFAQECSETVHCATGCCSEGGFCGVGDDFCGAGCQSTCDFTLGCDEDNPCADGTCCSRFGFCGLGPDFCSDENCVVGCDAKSICDPGGYGPEHAENANCPLNVCCSRWGYCGTTAEFCGEKRVKRPSCSGSRVKRVVGYFEGWAPRRRCQPFKPENVPIGVYTHINFAFAVIDPITYRIAPASASDAQLYGDVTGLKKRDKNLKVFIAIGAKQRVFFSSLVSFMSTYNFDGVDIDWEYPGAKNRGGRDGDFENMPVFIANLRKALQSSGTGRTGVSMALPVAYRYLQHFDIQKVAPHVDFFNMMSYDLHGSWDKTNEWVGPYLNSHTNLTEITEYLDLLWRNDIDPAKVNMGLAFYTRHFTAVSGSRMDPGCVYESVGPKGPCTNEIGGLSIAEVMDLETRPGAPAVLDPEAAVKIMKRGREWITYDDGTTWQLKVGRAAEMCLGGVMVWAINYDTAAGRFSRELQAATGYSSPGTSDFNVGDDNELLQYATQDTLINQCRWSTCGKGCPDGFIGVPRREGTISNSVMRSPTGCSGGQTSVFCCPAEESLPWCTWHDFNNGRCGKENQSRCPVGWSEIGSHSVACRSDSLWQVGCCIGGVGGVSSTKNYDTCSWQGTPPRCGFDKQYHGTADACENAGGREYLLDPEAGSGGALCTDSNGLAYSRAYCCDADSAGDSVWDECVWKGGEPNRSGHCASDCPSDTVRVAFQPAPKCHTGGKSSCCNGISKVNRRRSVGRIWQDALEASMRGECKNMFSTFDEEEAPPDRSEIMAQLRDRQTPMAACQIAVDDDQRQGLERKMIQAIVNDTIKAGVIMMLLPGTNQGCGRHGFLLSSPVTPTQSDLQSHINDPPGPMGTYGQIMLAQLGSNAYAHNMVVCEAVLNGIRARLWGLKNPMARGKWASQCPAASTPAALRGMSFLQYVLGVLDYLTETTAVKAGHQLAYEDVRDTLDAFGSHMQSVSPGHAADYKALWREYNTQNLKLVADFP